MLLLKSANKCFGTILTKTRTCKVLTSLAKYETCTPIGVGDLHDKAFCPPIPSEGGINLEQGGFTCQMLHRECGSPTTRFPRRMIRVMPSGSDTGWGREQGGELPHEKIVSLYMHLLFSNIVALVKGSEREQSHYQEES